MKAMVEWHQERYLDPAVWEKLIRNKVNPAVMPAPSVLQSLPPPPGGAGHSGDVQITSGLGSLSIGGVVASASCPGSYTP